MFRLQRYIVAATGPHNIPADKPIILGCYSNYSAAIRAINEDINLWVTFYKNEAHLNPRIGTIKYTIDSNILTVIFPDGTIRRHAYTADLVIVEY